jgi:hypothetical protein
MQSFRQSNPIDNINELQENIALTKERLLELDNRLYEQIPLMLEIPAIRQLVILNLELVLKYFNLQIKLNEFLNVKMKDLIIATYYFNFIIDLNNRYKIKIERMLDILKNEKKEKYNEIIELIKMYSLPFYLSVLGTNMPKLSAKDICISITKNIDDINLDPEKIKEALTTMSNKIQSQITSIESNVSDMVQNIEIPEINEVGKKLNEYTDSLKSNVTQLSQGVKSKSQPKLRNISKRNLNGGYNRTSFHTIYDPVNNKWVKTNSTRGINLINTYVVNLIHQI